MANKRERFLMIKYVFISLLVFVLALIVSMLARIFLISDLLPTHFTEEQAGLIASMIESVVSAIATGLVLYQLRAGNKVEEHQNNIEEGKFILQYNQSFIQDPAMGKVENALERAMLHKTNEPIINETNQQMFINYLVYLEGLAPLILNDVLRLENVDDLFAYRFFLAMNNKEIQEKQLFIFPEYYRGCFKLYEKWKRYRKCMGRDILLEDNSLDKWIRYEHYVDSPVSIRKLGEKDNKREVAGLIFDTDRYIYSAAFGNKGLAKRVIPSMIDDLDGVFSRKNIWIAEQGNHIFGVAVVLSDPPRKQIDILEYTKTYVTLPRSFSHVCSTYFNQMTTYFDETGTVYIACVSVDQKMRGQRIGEMLIKHLIHQYMGKRLKLHVLCDNEPALGLYEKYGFSRCGDPELGYAFEQPIPYCYEMVREAGFETINE